MTVRQATAIRWTLVVLRLTWMVLLRLAVLSLVVMGLSNRASQKESQRSSIGSGSESGGWK